MLINVIDAHMGYGKTSAMINYINESKDDVKFLYITPYLTEVDRIIEKCSTKKFRQPCKYGTKKNGIKYLFEKGENIVSTHSLFREFDQEIIDLAYVNNYVLVMDEVMNVIEPLDITSRDKETLLEKYTEIVDGHLLKWTDSGYKGKFHNYKKLCELESIGIYNDVIMLWLFPIATFRGFREIYILTYLFNSQMQKYYFDYHNISYKNLYILGNNVENYQLTDKVVDYKKINLSNLIHICNNEKLNRIGDMNTSLSKGWYKRNKNNISMKMLRDNLYNYFKNHTKTRSKFNLWTTFKDYQKILSGNGYSRGYISSNMRATNEYKDRIAVAYTVNKYLNPYVKNFFVSNNIEVDEDAFALSEMIQFIWRSAIREGNEIYVYCPSLRMRNILSNWIEGQENIKHHLPKSK